MDGKSSIGLQPNIAAALSYALIWIIGVISNSIISFIVLSQMLPGGAFGGHNPENPETMSKILFASIISQFISAGITFGAGFILFTMEKESRFVRLHAIQAILFNVLNFAVVIILGVMTMALGPGIGVLGIFVNIAFLVVWILLMVKAYKGDMLKLPVISDLAENIVTK